VRTLTCDAILFDLDGVLIDSSRVIRRQILLLSIFLFLLPICAGGCARAATTLDDLAPAMEEYLAGQLVEPHFGGQIFCSVEVFGFEAKQDAGFAFVWAYCMEYTVDEGKLSRGSGISAPVMVFMTSDNDSYLPTEYEMPRIGSYYGDDINDIFPPDVVEQMCLGRTGCYNERSARLEADVERKALEALLPSQEP